MRVLDFFKRQQPVEPKQTAPPKAVEKPPADNRRRVTPEELIEDYWAFAPVEVTATARVFSEATIQDAAAIYSARQLRRIADSVDAIRQHVVRPHLVHPPTDPAA